MARYEIVFRGRLIVEVPTENLTEDFSLGEFLMDKFKNLDVMELSSVNIDVQKLVEGD